MGSKGEKVVKNAGEVCKRGNKQQQLSMRWRSAALAC